MELSPPTWKEGELVVPVAYVNNDHYSVAAAQATARIMIDESNRAISKMMFPNIYHA